MIGNKDKLLLLETIDRTGTKKLELHEADIPNAKAKLAMDLVERWGMVAAKEDGEDSAGRQKLRLSSPAELVDRAIDVADLLIERFRIHGWMTENPLERMYFLDDDGVYRGITKKYPELPD